VSPDLSSLLNDADVLPHFSVFSSDTSRQFLALISLDLLVSSLKIIAIIYMSLKLSDLLRSSHQSATTITAAARDFLKSKLKTPTVKLKSKTSQFSLKISDQSRIALADTEITPTSVLIPSYTGFLPQTSPDTSHKPFNLWC